MAGQPSRVGANPFGDLPAISPDAPEQVHVIVDTPQGSRHKYKYDEQLGLFRLQRVLAEGLVFPFNFGYIPSTLAGDGDPLHAPLTQLRQLQPALLDQVEHFFIAYTSIQGKRFTPLRRGGAERARRLLARGMKNFEKG